MEKNHAGAAFWQTKLQNSVVYFTVIVCSSFLDFMIPRAINGEFKDARGIPDGI